MASSVTSSVTMRGSLLAAMFIPSLPNTVHIVDDDLPDAVQFLCREAVVVRQDNGFEPEFADGPVPAHMDVPRFVTVEAVEEEPIRARNTRDRWQGGYLQLLAQTLDLLPSPPQSRYARFAARWYACSK